MEKILNLMLQKAEKLIYYKNLNFFNLSLVT
jgi:hypothetical protein